MVTAVLILITIGSFLVYGVVGQDKAWVLGPAISVVSVGVAVALIQRAWGLSRNELSESEARTPPAVWLWVLFLLWGAAMVPMALSPFEGAARMAFLVAVVGAFVVLVSSLTAFKDNRLVLGLLIFVVTLAALYGLIAHFKVPDSVLWSMRYTDHYDGRLASTYICPNHFAHLMQMLLPFCVALLFIPQTGVFIKILSAYAFVVFMPTLFLTESRAGWLGGIAGVGVVVCLLALRKSKKLFAALIVLVPLVSMLLLVGAWRFSETFQRRMAPVVEFIDGQAKGGTGSDSPDFRPKTWLDSIDMIKEKPLVGYGPGNFRYAFPEHRYRFHGRKVVTGHPHNEYLELSADFGLVGFGLFAAAWVWGVVWVLVKSLKVEEARHAFVGFAFIGTVAGSMVHSFFDFQLHVFPNALMLAVLAAVAVGPLSRGKKRRSSRGGVPVVKIAAAWALVVLFLVGGVFCVRVMGSSFIRAYGDRALEVGSSARAESYYKWALRVHPANWKANKGLGELTRLARRFTLELDVKLDLARLEMARWKAAAADNPQDPEVAASLGQCLLFLGRMSNDAEPTSEEQGIEYLRAACRLRRFNDHYWWLLGVELRKSGRYEEALEAFSHALEIKQTPSSRKNVEWLNHQLRGGADDEEVDPTPVRVDRDVVLKQMETDAAQDASDDLEQLFELMK